MIFWYNVIGALEAIIDEIDTNKDGIKPEHQWLASKVRETLNVCVKQIRRSLNRN